MNRQRNQHAGEHGVQSAYRWNAVKEDLTWREGLWRERRGVKEWERNWGFLRGYDQLGRPKFEKPPPTNTTPFSDRMPNTANRVYGSRLSTPLAVQIVLMDRLLVGRANHRRQKINFDMKPF